MIRTRLWRGLLALPLLAPVSLCCILPGLEQTATGAPSGSRVTTAAYSCADPSDPAARKDLSDPAAIAAGLAAFFTSYGEEPALTDSHDTPRKNAIPADQSPTDPGETAGKTDADWRRVLTPEQYRIARQHGTEPAFTGRYWNLHDKGVYRCVCCGEELFRSDEKYDSGTGWPSFWAPIADGRLKLVEDHSHGMTRIEVLCGRCGAHLGHLFDDGPLPTGQRYCLNSASLDFQGAKPAK